MVNVIMLLTDLIIPLTLMIIGVWFKTNPPAFGSGIGYNTTLSQKNALIWDAAQSIYGRYALIFAPVTLIIGIVGGVTGIVLHLPENPSVILMAAIITVQTIFIFAGIFLTESKLKKAFNKDGTLKE